MSSCKAHCAGIWGGGNTLNALVFVWPIHNKYIAYTPSLTGHVVLAKSVQIFFTATHLSAKKNAPIGIFQP